MYEQNVNDPSNSIFTYEIIMFCTSHNQGFPESLLSIFIPFSWVLPGICSPGVKESSRTVCASPQASAIIYIYIYI